eukprot:scaffold27113_cov61-Phaeocystis_antarctica.AAC.1
MPRQPRATPRAEIAPGHSASPGFGLGLGLGFGFGLGLGLGLGSLSMTCTSRPASITSLETGLGFGDTLLETGLGFGDTLLETGLGFGYTLLETGLGFGYTPMASPSAGAAWRERRAAPRRPNVAAPPHRR